MKTEEVGKRKEEGTGRDTIRKDEEKTCQQIYSDHDTQDY